MTREFSFDVAFAEPGADGARIEVVLSMDPMPPEDRAAHIAEMTATIPWNTVRPALTWFVALTGEGSPTPPRSEAEVVVIPLAPTVTAPWQAAILLNLIDFALVEEDEELRLASRVTLSVPGASEWTPAELEAALQAQLDSARSNMTARLPDGTWIDEYSEGDWPDDAEYYLFEIALVPDRPLSLAEAATLTGLLKDLETLLGWMGFAVGEAPTEWQEQGKMLFGGEAVARAERVSWVADGPPSDIALAVTWIELALTARFGRQIVEWEIGITPRE